MTKLLILLWLLVPVSVFAGDDGADDTMLMFVGEERPVVTAASRYPESPLTAPAIVTLVDREQIENNAWRTLGELLADQPGFYIAPGGRGSVVYFRGLRDAVLFLYDGVPVTTDVTKSFAPLDAEFTLMAIERVEIIKGPGSVLWGADAFAAVVNLVPARGHQRPGVTVNATAGNFDQRAGQLTLGTAGRHGDLFLAASVARERFHVDHYQSDIDRRSRVDASRFDELVLNANLRDWLTISGRWSDFERHFTMTDSGSDPLVWDGTKETPFNYLKLSATGSSGPSHYSLTGFVQQTRYRLRDADVERQQRNRTWHLELLWDRRVLQRGLLTLGASWRRNDVDGALVRDGFQPDFLQPDVPLFTPSIDQRDFSSDVHALFGQFRYRWGHTEWWFGGRFEGHSDYNESFSGSLGFHVPLSADTRFKLAYGSAWRTPWSRQLFDDRSLDQEQINTVSAQLDYTPAPRHHYALTLFYSRVKKHRSEDPYGGLSLETNRDMFGLEAAARVPLTPRLSAHAGLSWVDGGSGDERFRSLAFSIVRPDGSRTDVYDDWRQAADSGPEWLAHLGLDWRIAGAHNLHLQVSTGGDVTSDYRKGTIRRRYDTPVLVALAYTRPGFTRHDHLSLRVTNLLDKDYQRPDVYGSVDGDPRRISLTWRVTFP